jgi:Protein of unknown function (DUF3303)
MLYLVTEHYLDGPTPVYQRAATQGRMLPDGLSYLDSWIVDDDRLDRCFQLMATDDVALFEVWTEKWRDLVSFEIFPVVTSAETASRVNLYSND